MSGFEDRKQATIVALKDPKVGDRFSEMLSFWVYVLLREGNLVVWMEAHPPCELPKDGIVKVGTLRDFERHFTDSAGAWVLLEDRGNDVSGWLDDAELP